LVAPAPIAIQTPTFEGSLATLFVCVRDRKIDLGGIPMAPICEAYWQYVIGSPLTNLDEAAAALVALAYLLERKAWLLLPTPEEEPEETEALDALPPSAHEYALVMDALRAGAEIRERMFFRSPEAGPDPYELPYKLEAVSARDLALALERVLSRVATEPQAPVVRPRRALSEVIGAVLLAVSDVWRPMERLIPLEATRSDVVYWFLALLELIRLGQVAVRVEAEAVEFARAQ
jgi:chromatin segregation and condensation protein Rec8/ScpA/Scc1 (kleisin family)